MTQNETINDTQDYVNYTFNIESKGVGIVAGELLGLSNTVSSLLGDLAFKTSELLSSTETLALGTSAAISGLFVSATKDAIYFEQQMANVKAIGGESLNAQEIGSAAMEYSNKFGMATASMTEGLEALARAGITTTGVMKGVLEEGVKLSKLEGLDLEDSINDLISTTNLLSVEDVNMNDSQYAEMVKQMNQHIVSTSESAPINAQNIIQSLQHVGGYASASGIDQDDLFAVIAQLGARGTKGEMAGTALRAFVAAGQKDTAQRALARIGLNVSDLWNDNGETMLSISEMKDVLDKAMENKGYSKQEKLEFYSDFAGYKQANQIMKINTSEVQEYKEQIANAWDLGTKLDTILGTVRGNLDRIWQTTQNFMTRVGGQLLTIANVILTPVRILLDLITNIPFADTAVAAGMIAIGFTGVLKIINNIVPRFSSFFIELSRSRKEMLDIRNIWRQLPQDIERARQTISAISTPKEMLELQKKNRLYSKKQMDEIEDKVARVFYIKENWDDERLEGYEHEDRRDKLAQIYKGQDSVFKQNFINELKVKDPDKWENAITEYLNKTTKHATTIASGTDYNIESIVAVDKIISIDEYVSWIWGYLSNAKTERETTSTDSGNNTPTTDGPKDNRTRNADERRQKFRTIQHDVFRQQSRYGDYSYRVNVDTGMPQFAYNDVEKMRAFEARVIDDINKKQEMYLRFLNDSSIEAGRNRLKKSLTVAAKTDLGYEFSTGANTSDIKRILETGDIRPKSSHITQEQLQDIADILETTTTGNTNNDMRRFYSILSQRTDKDAVLDRILQKTQKRWNDTYYNNGRVGFFPTQALKDASNGVTAQKIMDKVGVDSIEKVQQHFQNVALDDSLLNECVDIMYEDKELVDKLVDEEMRYMYENLARVKNSIRKVTENSAGFSSKGESTNLQKAREYVLSDFDPRDYANFTSSPISSIYSLKKAIDDQNHEILYTYGLMHEAVEGFQGYIFPIGTDIAESQRYGNDNFKIRNIKHVPYNDLLGMNVEDQFIDRDEDGERIEFMEVFADWVYNRASDEGNYWDNDFNWNYVSQYFNSIGDPTFILRGEETFNKLKQEFEDIYRAYIDLCAYGAQSLIESTPLQGPTISFRGGSFYTPENSFGAFDTITSTSMSWGVAKDFWYKNPQKRKMLEIYNPADVPGVIAHYDILNGQNDHLWTREREITLGAGQPYLHIPNSDGGMEKRILTLTPDQQKAVKEIMGEDFEFIKNSPNDPRYIKQELEKKEKEASAFLSAGESSNIPKALARGLHGYTVQPLNRDVLTINNIGDKLQDFLENGTILVDNKYRGGSLGDANSDNTIGINVGTIKYHADNYNEDYGDYGESLLDTVLHEMTHVLMMHKERQDYHSNTIPSELGIDNFQTSQLIQGYDTNFVAEYEAN